jgi:shikimate kinase
LQDIVDIDGYAALRKIEESVLLGLSIENHVIATGGSAVYSDLAMAKLKSEGVVIFLDVDLPTLEQRVHDFSTRGLAKKPDQSFADLYYERSALYAKYADMTIKCAGLNQEDVCSKIIDQIKYHVDPCCVPAAGAHQNYPFKDEVDIIQLVLNLKRKKRADLHLTQ